MPKTHELKIWPSHFEEIKDRRKTFEIRFNDRDFAVGDTLILRECSPDTWKGYTGKKIKTNVTGILHGGRFGLDPNYCIMSLGDINELD